MRTMFAGAIALALLAAASPPLHALERHDANVSSTQPETAPPLELAALVAADPHSLPAVAHPSADTTAGAPLLAYGTSPEVLAVAPGRIDRDSRMAPFSPGELVVGPVLVALPGARHRSQLLQRLRSRARQFRVSSTSLARNRIGTGVWRGDVIARG